MTALYERAPVFCITSDVDWASEDAIAIQQAILDGHGIHATYFVTHASAELARLYAGGRVDLGVHPNFLAGSSHGNSFEEVISTVLSFAPESRCYRGHRYYDVSIVAHMFRERGFEYDANLCTNLQTGIAPIRHESGLIRFATFFEDGTHFCSRQSWRFTDLAEEFARPGLKIISLHPMVQAMNVTTPEYWAELKRRFPPDEWLRVSRSTLMAHRASGPGPLEFLDDLLTFVKRRGFPVMTLDELYRHCGRIPVR
jgi:hypothetical protein